MLNYYCTQWTTERSVFGAISLWFCLCMKYLQNHWMDLRQIHMEDVFGPSLFFSLPNLSRRTLDVYHTSARGVALVRI